MRELKFRAWDRATDKMSSPFALFGEFTLLGAVHTWQSEQLGTQSDSLRRLNDLIVMQYTGLKDRNGIEIYESDIIKILGNFGGDTFYKEDTAIIEFVIDYAVGFGLKSLTDRDGLVMQDWSWKEIEVLGNIYENPKLLEEQ